MRLHHDKHHQAYVDNANKALAGTQWEDNSVESVLAELDAMPLAAFDHRVKMRSFDRMRHSADGGSWTRSR